MMRALTQEEYENELQPIVEQLTIELRGDGICETSFTDKLRSRHIIYPCDAQLDKDLVSALVDIMRFIDDPGLYIDFGGRTTYTNRRGLEETTSSQYYYIPIDQVEYAFNDEGIAETFMDAKAPFLFFDRYPVYSAKKRWAMVVEQEGHYALLGGDKALTDLLRRKCDQLGQPIQEFLAYWQPILEFTSFLISKHFTLGYPGC